MTANEMADRNEWACCAYSKEVSAMLRQQQAEIEALKQIIDANNLNQNIGQFVNEGTPDSELAEHKRIIREQQVEIEALKDKLEATKRFAFDMNIRAVKAEKRELTDEEIDEVWVKTCSDFKLIENGKTKGIINIYDVSRAILKKASEK
jgi:hypothetical protein